jgi:alkylation response protein AidB-like acyl-CoA dehydrogenase
MDFDLSSEQSQLKDSVDRLIGGTYVSLDARRAQGANALGFSARTWAQFAELGLLGIPFSEEEGGYGGGPVGTSLVMEAIALWRDARPERTADSGHCRWLAAAGAGDDRATVAL